MSVQQDSSVATATTDDSDSKLPPQTKVVLGLLLVAAFVMILNETVMSVAIPSLMDEFTVTAATAQWLTTGFFLTMAVVIPTTGFILRRFSTRAVFIAAMSLFAAGTLLAAVAPVFGVLIAARVIQASGTAIMLPLLTTTVLTFIPESRRGRTMGLISVVIAVAPAAGPTYSGFILSVANWRWTFLTVLPIALLSLVLGVLMIKNLTTPTKVRFDTLSVLLSAVTFGGLIYGLSSIGEATEGHAPIPPQFPLLLGVVTLALFVWRQLSLQRRDAALLDLRPFASRTFVVGIGIMLIAMGALFGSLILLPIYLQKVMQVSTLDTGLMLLPGGLLMGLIAPFIGRIFDKYGPRPVVIPGAIVLTGAMGMMSMLNEHTSVAFVVVTHVLLCMGLGSMLTPLMASTLGSLKPVLYSHGSAILSTLQQLAGAAGTALFITIMTTRAATYAESGSTGLEAQAAGIHEAFLLGTALAVVAMALTFLVKRPAPKPAAEEEPERVLVAH